MNCSEERVFILATDNRQLASPNRETYLDGPPRIDGYTVRISRRSKVESVDGFDRLFVETVWKASKDLSLLDAAVGAEEHSHLNFALCLLAARFLRVGGARTVEDHGRRRRNPLGGEHWGASAVAAEARSLGLADSVEVALPFSLPDSPAFTLTVRWWPVGAEWIPEGARLHEVGRQRWRLDWRGYRKRIRGNGNRLCGRRRDRVGQ
jgi:hypothetical protein